MVMKLTIHFTNGDVKKFAFEGNPDDQENYKPLQYFHKEHSLVLELEDDKTMIISAQNILYIETSPHAKQLSSFAIKNVKAIE